jgi:hypothetical protein
LKITAGTNVILRSLGDDQRQVEIARDVLNEAKLVVVTTPTLCEFAWALRSGYKKV